jgi:hypothetical protein
VLCKISRRFGNIMLPYGSILGGTFTDFRDPGHFVGKGFMQLEFDRLYVGDNVFPVDAKVVDVPGYRIDTQGRIMGKGHAVRDTITWMIPVLWPIDLLTLPRRGPRPTLKAETMLTLRVMDDIQLPVTPEPQRDPNGLIPRGGDSYAPPPEPPAQQQQPAPQMAYQPQPQSQPQPQPDYNYSYAPPPPPPAPVYMPMVIAQPVFVAPPPMLVAQPMIVAPPPVVAYGTYFVTPGYVGPGAYYTYRTGYASAPQPAYRYGYTGPYGYTGSGWSGQTQVYGAARFVQPGMAYRAAYRGY